MNSREISEEIAAQTIDPTDEWRADLRSAVVAQAVAAAQGAKASIDDFMPKFGPQDEVKETDEDRDQRLTKDALRWAQQCGGVQ